MMKIMESSIYDIIPLLDDYIDIPTIASLSQTCVLNHYYFQQLQYGYFNGIRYPNHILQLINRMNTTSSIQYINVPKSRTSQLLMDYGIAFNPIRTLIVHDDPLFESPYMHCDWDTFRQNKEISSAYDRVILYYVGNNSSPAANRAINYILNKQVWIFGYSAKAKSKLLPLYKPYIRNGSYINAYNYQLKSVVKLELVNIDDILGITDIPAIMFALGYPELSKHYVNTDNYQYRIDQVLFLGGIKYTSGKHVMLYHNASSSCGTATCNMCSLLIDTVIADNSSNHIVVAAQCNSITINSILESNYNRRVRLTILYSPTMQGIMYEQRIRQGTI